MSKDETQAEAARERRRKEQEDKAARLGEALRANLRRRKAQTRARGHEPAPAIKNKEDRNDPSSE